MPVYMEHKRYKSKNGSMGETKKPNIFTPEEWESGIIKYDKDLEVFFLVDPNTGTPLNTQSLRAQELTIIFINNIRIGIWDAESPIKPATAGFARNLLMEELDKGKTSEEEKDPERLDKIKTLDEFLRDNDLYFI